MSHLRLVLEDTDWHLLEKQRQKLAELFTTLAVFNPAFLEPVHAIQTFLWRLTEAALNDKLFTDEDL